ncbi:MAG: protein kinase, partial [Gemmataceae bacterium]
MEAPANEERLLAVRPDREGDFLFGAELAHVLRGRLVLLCLIILATAAIELVFIQLQADRFDWAMTDRNLALTVLTLYLLPLGLLWRRRDLSLHTLRLVETAIFMGAAAFLGIGEYLWYRSGWLEVIAQPGQEANFMEVLGDSLSLPWFALIVFYGVCIPSTGRQCARVVAALDLAAVALFLAIYDVDDPLAPMMSQTLPIKLFFWLSLASAVAVYGSQKLSELRREAFEARRLGQYTLKELLGKGGMGEVYLAEHKLLKRPCALKLIRTESAGHARVLDRFEREVQATAALTHPNVVEIYDYGHADDGTFYYVMDLLRGMNLAELVEKHGP